MTQGRAHWTRSSRPRSTTSCALPESAVSPSFSVSTSVTTHDRRKLTRVCAAATEALAAVSPKKASAPPLPQEEPERASATAKIRQREYAAELFERAREAYDSTDYWEAIQLSRQATELDETNAAYHHLLGLGLMKNQNWKKEAEESLHRATELDESKPEYFTELASLYEREGMTEHAATMRTKAAALDGGGEASTKSDATTDPRGEDDEELEVEVDVEAEAETTSTTEAAS